MALSVGLLTAGTAAAQSNEAPSNEEIEPPPIVATTSGDVSLLSGRTNGTGEVVVAGGAGWPGVWGQLDFGIDPAFNLGARVSLLYGPPFMALEAGVGGELALPARIHLLGEDTIDLAIFVTPAAVLGEAVLAGQGGTAAAGDFGWGFRGEAGVVAGWRALDALTVIFGAGGHVGFVNAPSAGDFDAVGGVFARVGVEGLLSRDLLLFAVGDAGVGFAPTRVGGPLYRESFPPLLRLSLGVGYLL